MLKKNFDNELKFNFRYLEINFKHIPKKYHDTSI